MIANARALRAALALLGLVLLAGCGRNVPTAVTAKPEITVVMESSSASLNPYASTLAQRRIGRLVFQGLFSIDRDGMPFPDLCEIVPTFENGGISDDGKTIRYKLREARFHDGTPVRAADVVFTLERLRSGELVDEPGMDLSVITAVSEIDERTVEVRLRSANSPLAWRLVPFVLPSHLLGDSPDLLSDPFWLSPVGSGPYRVATVRPGASVQLRKTGDGAGPATLDCAFVPSQSAGRAVFDDAPKAIWLDAPVGVAGVQERSVETTSAVWWRLNALTDAGSVAADDDVRWAVRSLVEREWTTATVGPVALYGFAPPERSLPTTAQIGDRLERARWRRSRDGVRTKAGRRLEATLRTPPLEIAEGQRWDRVRAAALDAGILLEVRPSGPKYYGDYLEGGVLSRAEGDFFLTAIAVGAPPGYAWPFDPADTPSFGNPGGLNWQRIDGSSASALTNRIRSARGPDSAVRTMRSAWRQLDRSDEVVWLYPEQESALVKGVVGVSAHPFAEMALTGYATWRATP